jgi:hypothetical protein
LSAAAIKTITSGDTSREADHRIANNLSILASLIGSQVKSLPEAGVLPTTHVREMLNELAIKVTMIADLHRLLACSQKWAAVELRNYLHPIVDLIRHSLAEEKQTTILCDFPPGCAVSARSAVAIALFTVEGGQRLGKIAAGDALQVEHRNEHLQALRTPRIGRQDRRGEADAIPVNADAVAHPRQAHLDRADTPVMIERSGR